MTRLRSAPLLVLTATLGACAGPRFGSPEELEAHARELCRTAPLIDTHVDVPIRLYGQGETPDDVAQRTPGGHFDWVRAREGGLDVPFMSIYVPASFQASGGARDFADRMIDLVEGLVAAAPDKFALATSPADARRLAGSGRLGLALGIENGAAIEDDLANLAHFHARGVRYVTLTHSENNLICDSSYASERLWNGLSPFGRQVVREMNRLGLLVDVSHVSDEAFDDVLEVAVVPPIASHSSCRRFVPGFERNLDDARIRALAAAGGVLQINFGSAFLTAEANRQQFSEREEIDHLLSDNGVARGSDEARELVRRYREEHPRAETRVADVADHIDHVVALVGVDHVGIGSDYDGVGSVPVGLEDVSRYPALVAELLRRGWSDADLRKLLGENTLRVWEQAERHARAARAR